MRKPDPQPSRPLTERVAAPIQHSASIEHSDHLTLAELRKLVQETAGWHAESPVTVSKRDRQSLARTVPYHKITATAKETDT